MRALARRAAAGALAAGLVAGFLAGCAGPDGGKTDEEEADEFGYQVPVALSTPNAGSDIGASQFAQTWSGRLYPGVYVPGPNGQMIPNTDLVTAQALPAAQRIVQYTLSEGAVFSDGAPVTCTDFLLTFAAGKNPELFGSHLPLFDDVEKLECTPGAKTFDLVFKEGAGARWRELFSAGTVLPAHAVAAKLSKDVAGLNADLYSGLDEGDVAALRPIAQVWHDGFNLDQFDPALQVSFGPYVIDGVGEAGQVHLVANEKYYGGAPLTKEIVVWPASADSAQLNATGNLRVAELAEPNPGWLDVNAEGNSLEVTTAVGALTDSLTFASFGPWSYPENRAALAKCVDPRAVAAASSKHSGAEVSAFAAHVVSHDDPLASRFDDIAGPHLGVDIEGAKQAAGLELRVGYAHASPRMAAMVESIRVSCEPAGITVVDATEQGKTLRDLSRVELGEWGEEVAVEGSIDAMLRPVDPASEYNIPGVKSRDVEAMRKKETELWEKLPSIPLAAQPRVFAVDRNLGNVMLYTGPAGIGWNMDRWLLRPDSADQPPA
ncbi:ABC transporter substrate-binding protein [Corynebacterium liangguodongii]|uniref:ABC transporter substrate-binding protein n=1 Tax=Corynebacterium liangguodongii TaxID=2079535 RepID=UPI001F39B84F|nr:ABC transporter substrate-binding protein [Corynebacterium liangguodongii]